MGRFVNDFEIEQNVQRFRGTDARNRLRAALVVSHLADWANDHSDGWAYWPKPARAAAKAIEATDARTYADREAQERTDLTDAELVKVIAPIKAFLTRCGPNVSAAERAGILLPVTQKG